MRSNIWPSASLVQQWVIKTDEVEQVKTPLGEYTPCTHKEACGFPLSHPAQRGRCTELLLHSQSLTLLQRLPDLLRSV